MAAEGKPVRNSKSSQAKYQRMVPILPVQICPLLLPAKIFSVRTTPQQHLILFSNFHSCYFNTCTHPVYVIQKLFSLPIYALSKLQSLIQVPKPPGALSILNLPSTIIQFCKFRHQLLCLPFILIFSLIFA